MLASVPQMPLFVSTFTGTLIVSPIFAFMSFAESTNALFSVSASSLELPTGVTDLAFELTSEAEYEPPTPFIDLFCFGILLK